MARKTKKERRERRKKIGQKIKNGVKKAAKMVGKVGQIAALEPFRPVMMGMLKKRGVKPERKLEALAKQFKTFVIDGKDFENPDNLVDDVVSIVKSVIDWLRNRKDRLKDKEAKGEKLSEGDENFVDAIEASEKAAKEMAVETVKEGVGNKITDVLFSPLGVLLLIAGVFALKKFV